MSVDFNLPSSGPTVTLDDLRYVTHQDGTVCMGQKHAITCLCGRKLKLDGPKLPRYSKGPLKVTCPKCQKRMQGGAG